MSEKVAQATCQIHFRRPAAAKCMVCKLYYCKECVTEHDGKNTCASCLKSAHEESATPVKHSMTWFQPMPIIHLVLALILMWAVSYLVAQTLSSIPDSFHEGTIWE